MNRETVKLYRFSPIQNIEMVTRVLEYVHEQSHRLCDLSLSKHLPALGNNVIFTHYGEEYEYLSSLRETLCKPAAINGQKYYELIESITFPVDNEKREVTYTHLYIRKPDPWRSQVGDMDFHVSEDEYIDLKQNVAQGDIPHARVFPEVRLDMIELFHPDIDVLAYIHPQTIEEVVKITKSGTDAPTSTDRSLI